MATKTYPYPFNKDNGSKFISGDGTWKEVYTKEQIDDNELAIAGAMAEMDEKITGFEDDELVTAQALTYLNSNKENACRVKYVSTDTQVLENDTFYIFTEPVSSLTLSYAQAPSGNKLLIYGGMFTASADDIQITLPSGVAVTDEFSGIETSHTYEFSIMNGICIIADITTTQKQSVSVVDNGFGEIVSGDRGGLSDNSQK